MPDYNPSQKTELSDLEQQTEFLLHAKGEIVHVLNDLAKKPDIITVYFGEGSQYILTAVLGVLPERNLVVLDDGPDEALNDRVLRADRLLCITKHESIHIKFTLQGLQRARYQGKPVFAAPLPDTLFRLQRREFFRVRTPITTPVTCEVPWGGARREVTVLDIGYGGLALLDENATFPGTVHDVLESCLLHLPEFGSVELDLEVRNIIARRQKDATDTRRVGCRFVHLPMQKNVVIQRYIHQLQIVQKQLSG